MPIVMAALSIIGGALYKSSSIPFLVPRGKAWLTPTARVPCSNARLGRKVNFAPAKIPLGGKSPENVYVSAQEMAKHRAKFG